MAESSKVYSEDAKPKWSSATDTISADIRAAAARMVADSRIPGSSLGTLLNGFLNKHIPWPYHAGPGNAFDSTGTESSKFESLIYTSSDAVERLPADNLACAIDVHENLSLERLRQTYEKIVDVKTLTKATIPTVSQGIPVADATMGIIFARESDATKFAAIIRKTGRRLTAPIAPPCPDLQGDHPRKTMRAAPGK
jgi:hypothetical protein